MRLKTLMLAAVATLPAFASNAAPISFNPSPQAQARTVTNVVFADYLAQRVGVQVETAVLDLDNNQVGEIFTRFVHSGSCLADMKTCRTTIIRHDGQRWRIVFDQFAKEIVAAEVTRKAPADITVDGIKWTWDYPSYAPTSDGLGSSIEFKSADKKIAQSLSRGFGAGAEKLIAADPRFVVNVANVPMGKGNSLMVATLSGGSACGEAVGCPVRVMKKDGAAWSTVLETTSMNEVYLRKGTRAGHNDIAVKTQRGFVSYTWNGSKYQLSEVIEAPVIK